MTITRPNRIKITPEVKKRIEEASQIYLSDYTIKIKDLASRFEVSPKTMRENLMVQSKLVDEHLHQEILMRDYYRICEVALIFLEVQNIRKTSKNTGLPKSTVYDILTKQLPNYENLFELYNEVSTILEQNKEHRKNAIVR